MRFAKGHGTGNDFLILPDPDDALTLPAELVARLCDRRTGLGADGILRAVRVSSAGSARLSPGSGGTGPGSAGTGPGSGAAGWFMDYRNADGSAAEMCGNGIRVFTRYLLAHGLAEGPALTVATRAGPRRVWTEASGEITVDMGMPRVLGRSAAAVGGRRCDGLEVSLGNPHLACLVDVPVAELDLSAAPVFDHARFPEGANVEVVRVLGGRHLEMRVYERGSGVTLSCGTGAIAAAVAAAVGGPAAGPAIGVGPAGTAVAAARSAGGAADRSVPADRAGAWTVDVPGGRLTVTLSETTSLLTGPAVIVAEGDLSGSWLSGLAGLSGLAAAAPGRVKPDGLSCGR